METFGRFNSPNSDSNPPAKLSTQLVAALAAMSVAAPAFSQGPAADPPAPGANGAASNNQMSAPPPAAPPAQDPADLTCRLQLELCTQQKGAVQAALAKCEDALRQCQQQPTPASVKIKKTTKTWEKGKNFSKETITEETTDRTPEILDAIRRMQQPPVGLAGQATSVVVNVYNNPHMENNNANNSYNKGATQSSNSQSEVPAPQEEQLPVSSSGLNLYGRMGLGVNYFFDKKGTGAVSGEGWAMVRSNGGLGFGARAAYEVAPYRLASMEDMVGTVPTHSLLIQGCAEKPAPQGGLVVGVCAGAQREEANDVVLDKNPNVKLSGWTRYAERAMAYLGFETSPLIGSMSFSFLGRIGAAMSRRDSVAGDRKDTHSVPEIGATIGVKFD